MDVLKMTGDELHACACSHETIGVVIEKELPPAEFATLTVRVVPASQLAPMKEFVELQTGDTAAQFQTSEVATPEEWEVIKRVRMRGVALVRQRLRARNEEIAAKAAAAAAGGT